MTARAAWLLMMMTGWLGMAMSDAAFAAPPFPAIEWEKESLPGRTVKGPVVLSDGTLLGVDTLGWGTGKGLELVCFRSQDAGTTWTRAGVVARDLVPHADLGDSALLVLRSGEILCSYRRNHLHNRPQWEKAYSIEVAMSTDGGFTWSPHSVVTSCRGLPVGVWSSCLFQRHDGELQCYYDDEYTPWQEGFTRHQWLTVKSWDAATSSWLRPITVSRANNPAHLSRDGMCSVVELAENRLICVFESVRVEPPHKGILFCVTSDDGGRSWSWSQKERTVVYETRDKTYNSLAPWITRLRDERLLCVFVTDEDRPTPDTPATGRLDEDLKAVISEDGGQTWSSPPVTLATDHPCYLPGVVSWIGTDGVERIVVPYAGRSGPMVKRGRVGKK